jgi:hypothetical protein
VGEDFYRIQPDERLRVTTLDVAGRPISVLVSSAVGSDVFEVADAVLATLEIDR